MAELENLHGFIPDSLSLQGPVLIIDILASRCLLDVERHDFLTDAYEILDVFLKPGDDHSKVVSSDVSSALGIVVAVIKFIQNVHLFFEVSCQSVNVFSPALNSIFCFAVLE